MGNRFVDFMIYIALMIVLLGLINITFRLHKLSFVLGFFVLLGFLLVAVVSVVGMHNRFDWVWKLLRVFFGLALLDMLFVYLLLASKPEGFLPFAVAAIAGFFISSFNSKRKADDSKKADIKKTYEPGKYIASRSGSKFHAPKCDWAKKVKKSNAV